MQITFTISSSNMGAQFFLLHGLPSLLRSRAKHGDPPWASVNFAIVGNNYSAGTMAELDEILSRFKCNYAIKDIQTTTGRDAYAQRVMGTERRVWPCDLYPDSDIFIYLEDDMLFGEDTFLNYMVAAKGLIDDPSLGVVYCTGHMGSGGNIGVVHRYTGTLAWSGRGLVFRNLMKLGKENYAYYVNRDIPRKICFEDKAVIYSLPRSGFGVGRIFGVNTRHFTADSSIPRQYLHMFNHKLGNNYRTMDMIDYMWMPDHDFFASIFNLTPFNNAMPRHPGDVKRMRFTPKFQRLVETAGLK